MNVYMYGMIVIYWSNGSITESNKHHNNQYALHEIFIFYFTMGSIQYLVHDFLKISSYICSVPSQAHFELIK